jgi:TonB-linked SusC/RagA family outer membrane protein
MKKYIQKSSSFIRVSILSFMIVISIGIVAQNPEQKTTIRLQNVSVKDLIRHVENITPFTAVYRDVLLDDKKDITVNEVDKPLSLILKKYLEPKGLNVIFNKGVIIITKAIVENTTLNTPKSKKISGLVTDEKGDPIIGATIVEIGTNKGTVSDINGQFSLETANTGQLKVSYLGYESLTVAISDKSLLKVSLIQTSKNLEEIIVIGYGSLKKKDITGAVSSVKTNDLQKSSAVSVGQLMSGKAAGLQIIQNFAQPGGDTSFLIRGAASVGAGNNPLIIIDGFPVSSLSEPGSGNAYDGGAKSDLNSINPNDIESVEVLKDASATAIYGSRAANGVILITSKRGKEGKVKVDYNGSYSGQIIADNYDILSASDLMSTINMYRKENYIMQNKFYPYGTLIKSEDEINKMFTPTFSADQIANPQANTNWYDLITRNGLISQHNISLSGGSKLNQYLVSLNYFNQDGVIKNSGLERFTGRVNLDQQINKYIKFGMSATASRILNTNSQLGGSGNELSGIIRSALTFPTFLPLYDEEGNYSLSSTQPYLPNPVSLLQITDQSIMERILANTYAEITPFTGLSIRGSVGVDRNTGKRTTYLPKTTLYGAKESGKASISTNERLDLLTNVVATYSTKLVDKHSFSAMAGYEFQRFEINGFGATNSDFLLDSFLWYNLASGEAKKPAVFSSGGVESMASYFGRLNLSVSDRYLFTTTMRADGSSKFARNKKWGYFPSMAVGWRITEEDFMEILKPTLSNLKLRISYGSTGNANIGYNALAAYRTGQNFQFGDKVNTGVYASQLENPNLSWETSTELNIGLDFGFFNHRINGSVEYFSKIIDGLLSSRNLPTYNEITTIADNIGKTQSKGFELTLNTVNIQEKDLAWNSTLTFSLYRDRWLERAPTWTPAIYQSSTDYIRNNYFYKSDGLIQPGQVPDYMPAAVPGQVKLLDMNGYQKDTNGNRMVDENGKFIYSGQPDGVLDEADIVNYGNADPGFMLGFNNTIIWKNFDLNIYFYGYFNRLLIDPNSYIGINHQLGQEQGGPTSLMNSWRHDNTSSTQPSLINSSFGFGDYLLQDGSFLRCKNITLAYKLSPTLIGKVFQNARIYLDVQNPFKITKYKGIDPETDVYVAAYPNVRTFSVGVDLAF